MGDMNKIRPNKKVVLSVLGVLVVLVVAAGAGIGLRLLQNDKAAEESSGTYKGKELPKEVGEAQNLRLAGDTEGSLKKIDEALADKNTSADERYQLLIQQGNAYHDKQENEAAIAAYLKAEQAKETFEIVSLLALMYEESGNNAKAVEYYKRSIPIIPDSPMQNQYKIDAENKIKTLGGQS